MWIKTFNGYDIKEDLANGDTWLKTSCKGIVKVYLECGGLVSTALAGMDEYWHSRGAIVAQDGTRRIVCERIQGKKQGDSHWRTITWDGSDYISSLEPKAYGKPD